MHTAIGCICVGIFCLTALRQSHAEGKDSFKKDPLTTPNYHFCLGSPSKTLRQAPAEMICYQPVAGDSSLPQVNKKFLVVLHMVQDSTGNYPLTNFELNLARAYIARASELYAGIGISFEASESVNLIENYSFNELGTETELSQLSNTYAKEHRINLFIVERFNDELEWSCGLAGGNSIYMAGDCIAPSAFAHESGHIFGLAHTFGTGDVRGLYVRSSELVDGSNCETTGDFVCDTPADPFTPRSGNDWENDCAFIYEGTDANGDYYDPDLGNVMAYYNGTCACGDFFTDGQLRRVAEIYRDSVSNYLWW